MTNGPRIVHLREGGVSVALVADDRGVRLLHWGAALADDDVDALAATDLPSVAFSSFDAPRVLPLVPVDGDGWSGHPGVAWHRDGSAADAQLVAVGLTDVRPERGGSGVRVDLRDEVAQASVAVTLVLDVHGVLATTLSVTNLAETAVLDLGAARAVLPLPTRATEILDMTGRWTRERAPQRLPVVDGAHVRATRRGRPGHDAPILTMVGTPGLAFRTGEVWAAHVAWSGNQEVVVERLPEGAGVHGAVIAAGELLAPGEIRLAPGATYVAPTVVCAWSDAGLDGVSRALHRHVRALPSHPERPRPVTLNTWEAVYFDHDPARLASLASTAARIGVERFVLDDGWFRGRHGDDAGLGDWEVDRAKWPEGLGPLARHVHGLGMELGLWVEPEMVNRDSDLARRHPDWILGVRDEPAEWRHQLVLDLTRDDARAHMLARLDALVSELGVDYLKWDHNRELHGAVSRASGRAAVHAQTTAVYALIDELRARHPRLEIESCASGGARVDLGMLARVQRVWASDTNDPVERQAIQRWTGLLVPPELVGSHVGPGRAHTTHRTADLSMRMLTAHFGHAGIEWAIDECGADELEALARWIAMHREQRALLHSGETVRADLADPGLLLHGVVAADGRGALFAYVRIATSGAASTPRTPIPGLEPALRYRVRVRDDLGGASRHSVADPAWIDGPLPVMSGAVLASAGVPLPQLDPGQGVLIELIAV
ncbi:alpha-galactosidase [Demequina maris]|uniref:alpha-galactosidase n=1 Tax=Demequina maris TaxID=1638982 RepID=UPI0007820858|nr:alpha-galactosidase [Demequina maris]